MNSIQQLSRALAVERKQKGLTPAVLAQESGVSRAGVYRFAKGGDIRLSTFLALCDQLGVDLVLAPKAVAPAVQAAAAAVLAPLNPDKPAAGPQSAVAARLQKLQRAAQGGKP